MVIKDIKMEEKEKNPFPFFWKWLEENHPVINNVIQFGILGLATAALIKSFF